MNNWTGEASPSLPNVNMFIESLKPFEVQQKFLREENVLFTLVRTIRGRKRMKEEVGEERDQGA